MSDLISRQAAIALAKDIIVPIKDGTAYKYRCIDPDAIKELPSAEPERKTGKWIIYDIPLFDGGVDVKCSECGQCGCASYWDFCPNCGAKMEVDDA